MEPTAPIPQSPTGDAARRLSFLRSSTIALCFCLSTFGTASAVMSAPTPSQIPLFEESPIPTPPSIAQALPEARVHKRWVRRQRTMTLNPAALDVMNRPRAEAQTDVTLNFFDTGLRTLNLDQPREYPKQTKVWRGRLRGETGSDVTLVTHGTTMTGTILSNHRLYKIEAAGGNLHRLVEVDEEALPRITIPSSWPTMIPLRHLHGRSLTADRHHCRSSW